MKPTIVTSLSVIYKNLQEIGKESVDGCKSPDPVLAKKFQEINKLAKNSFDLLDKNSIIKGNIKKIL